ncbi:prenylcysteine oxidase 1-like isoform X2 [Dendropsophus ebraccatus]|uniref:prenylcysteine oxidase 1-like isoform X2 n=1 Tax=Dendropsophus ebraccatus TaxID=150705 RepID=UPI00383204D4
MSVCQQGGVQTCQRSKNGPLVLYRVTAAAITYTNSGANQIHQQERQLAVVGAGIGGTSAAYFLRQKFGKDVQIDVFEKGEVGGRMSTAEMEGNHYEAGGSVIHPLNLHMKTFVKELGLSALPLRRNLVGIYNGDEFVYQENEWYLLSIIKMIWNYGLSFFRMHLWVEDILDKFTRIYRYQTFDYSFSSIESMFHAIGGNDYVTKLNVTVEEDMQKSGLSQRFIDDIVVPSMRGNYGQGAKVNSFVGAVSLSCADSGIWTVKGGNQQVCTGLLSASKAQLVQGTVTSVQEKVRPTKSGDTIKLYEVSYETDKGRTLDMYDIVVIATPLNKGIGNIKFVGFDPPIETFSKPFHQIVTTFVHGRINSSFFGCPQPCQLSVSEISTTNKPNLFMNSIVPVYPVKPVTESELSKASDIKVWRIYSPEPLTDEQLRLLFELYHAVIVKDWLACPKYTPPEKLPPIILHRDIYYVNSIEGTASGMEMSAISAKNIALLSYHRWFGKNGQIDQEDLAERLKSEL